MSHTNMHCACSCAFRAESRVAGIIELSKELGCDWLAKHGRVLRVAALRFHLYPIIFWFHICFGCAWLRHKYRDIYASEEEATVPRGSMRRSRGFKRFAASPRNLYSCGASRIFECSSRLRCRLIHISIHISIHIPAFETNQVPFLSHCLKVDWLRLNF